MLLEDAHGVCKHGLPLFQEQHLSGLLRTTKHYLNYDRSLRKKQDGTNSKQCDINTNIPTVYIEINRARKRR
jgi:hypothetical protein